MGRRYKVKDSFYVNGRTVLHLDPIIRSDEYKNEHIIVSGKYMPYMFTYNDYWITVEGKGDYTNQTVEFVK